MGHRLQHNNGQLLNQCPSGREAPREEPDHCWDNLPEQARHTSYPEAIQITVDSQLRIWIQWQHDHGELCAEEGKTVVLLSTMCDDKAVDDSSQKKKPDVIHNKTK